MIMKRRELLQHSYYDSLSWTWINFEKLFLAEFTVKMNYEYIILDFCLQRDGCPKIVNLGSAKTDLFYERKKYGFKKRWSDWEF